METPPSLSTRKIFTTWWPLAFSWLLMSVEIPALSAVIARLANPEVNLAAYGGIVFPVALIIEAPVIMLLAASTALCVHYQAYRQVWKFMMTAGAVLTAAHALVAFTPLYDLVTRRIIGAPEEIIAPAQIGLQLMLPWTWSIAYRRFHQGLMIRYGYSRAVGMGTIVRLVSGGAILLAGYHIGRFPGVAVGAAAQGLAVLCEAIYSGWRARVVIREILPVQPVDQPLTWAAFFQFYIPLALTSFITLIWQPIGSAAMSRMPAPLQSLAVWPAVSGISFLLRSPGLAFNEVAVALLGLPGAWRSLRRFAAWLAVSTVVIHLLIAATPLADLYFRSISALPDGLVTLAVTGFWLFLPMPAIVTLQSWFQGAILHSRVTRAIPESVLVFFLVVVAGLAAGITWGSQTGLYVAVAAFVLANLAQMIWLRQRSRAVLAALRTEAA